jgi:hypothetical protein
MQLNILQQSSIFPDKIVIPLIKGQDRGEKNGKPTNSIVQASLHQSHKYPSNNYFVMNSHLL